MNILFDPKIIYKRAVILAALLALLLCAGTAHAEKVKKSVLFLNSYHNGYHWSDGILEGVRSILEESNYKIDLQIEYMDAKKFAREGLSEMLFRMYSEKFRYEHFDVVIASDNVAFDFASKYRSMLFPGVPLVFCGINDLEQSMLEQGNVTGVEEVFDLGLTLDVVTKLHPDKHRMVVVGDESSAGRAIRRQVQAMVPKYKDHFSVEYWTRLSLEEVQRRVAKLPDDTFLFFIPYYQVIDGRFYTAEEVIRAIYERSSVPIYTSWKFLVGHGAVGGMLISGYRHGQIAAGIAFEILDGKKASTIPPVQLPTGEYIFDYEVMKRLGINQAKLPEGSHVINAPSPFYELPKELFWTIIVSFVLILIVMVFLISTMLERRKIERKVKDQLAFLETLMDTVPQLVSWKNAAGRYLGANRAFAEFFGLEDNSGAMGKAPHEFIGDGSHIRWSTSADQVVVKEGRAFRKVRRKLADASGNQAWLEINKVPIRDQSGRIVGSLSTAENITKERNLEKQLLQSQKMEAIGTLAGGIAHDFNNILTSIINSTELAVGDVDEDSVTGKDLRRVLKAARRGGRVVKQILAFSRPSTEGFRPMNLGTVVGEVLGLLEASMPSNIHVRSKVAPHLPDVIADPTQLHQVLMNLCTNSFHALRDLGGTIEVRVELAELNQEDGRMLGLIAGSYVRLIVADDGPGIPAEIVDKIFDPFFSTKDKTEGTGLGLAVVHGIVRSHKGGLHVTVRPGGGTLFEIFLPLASGDTEPVHHIGHSISLPEARILFVEDDEDQLVTTPRILEAMGFHVTALRRPEEALGRVRGMPYAFDLVITDYDMPGMSGTELAKGISQVVPGLPVILVSGREDAVAAVVDLPNIRHVVIKPYDKNDLHDAIGKVLNAE